MPRNAAETIIKPLLTRFLQTYPDIRLEVATQDGFVDIVAEGFDAGIRVSKERGQDVISVPVGPALRFAVVASPGYIARHGTPLVPQDLRAHSCVARRYSSGALYTWAFARGSETTEVAIPGRLVLDDRSLIVAAALDGFGLAHIHEAVVADHVARGELVRVLEDWCPVLSSFHLYYPGRRQVPGPLRAFIGMATGKPMTALCDDTGRTLPGTLGAAPAAVRL